MSIDERLAELGIQLPPASNPAANYTNCVRTGNLLSVSGKGPRWPDGSAPKGKLGREFSTKEGYEFARLAALDILAAVKLELGSLDRVRRVVKIQGFVNATSDFEEHPQVLNGASDLMVEVFAERGVHARSVLGATSLRAGLPIVIEAIFEVEYHWHPPPVSASVGLPQLAAPRCGLDAERKARLGARWTCSECATAYYDLGKPEAACPRCGAKQLPTTKAPAKAKRAPKKKSKGNYRGGLQRGHGELEARPEALVIVEPLDNDESAAAEEDLES